MTGTMTMTSGSRNGKYGKKPCAGQLVSADPEGPSIDPEGLSLKRMSIQRWKRMLLLK